MNGAVAHGSIPGMMDFYNLERTHCRVGQPAIAIAPGWPAAATSAGADLDQR